jgi:hypothetical protein
MKLTGHQMEAVYRCYAIVCEADLGKGLKELVDLDASLSGKFEFSYSSATISGQKDQVSRIIRVEEPVLNQPFSAENSLHQGYI